MKTVLVGMVSFILGYSCGAAAKPHGALPVDATNEQECKNACHISHCTYYTYCSDLSGPAWDACIADVNKEEAECQKQCEAPSTMKREMPPTMKKAFEHARDEIRRMEQERLHKAQGH